jgi:aminocarboxymuconate-semialdehyde decarboxylase
VPVVDIHTHVIPAPLLARAEAGRLFGVRTEGGGLVHPEGFRYPITADFHDRDALLARMAATGVDRSIVSLAPTLFLYDKSPAEGAELAREANDAVAALVRGAAALDGFATLPLQDPAAAAGELRRAVGELGLLGAQIGTSAGSVPLDAPALAPVLEEAQRLGVPLVLHPYYTGDKPGLGDFYMTNTVGNPLDTCVAATRLIVSGALDRFPRLKVALVHGGGFFPYQLGRLDRAYAVRAELQGAIARPPSEYLQRFWIDGLLHADAPLAFLARLVGPDRLVLGTDLPFDMGDPAPVERVRGVGIELDALARATDLLLAR